MAITIDRTKRFMTIGVVILVFSLIAIYVYNKVTAGSIIGVSSIIFIVILGIIVYSIFYLYHAVSGQTATDIDKIWLPIVVIGVLLYIMWKFPNLVPLEFSIAVHKIVPSIFLFGTPLGQRKGSLAPFLNGGAR